MAGVPNDLTVYWGTTQVTGTNGRILARLPVFSPYESSPTAEYVGAMDVWTEQGDPQVQPMTCTLEIRSAITATTATLVEQGIMDEVRALLELMNPFDGANSLRFDRSNTAGTALSVKLPTVRIISAPRYGDTVVMGNTVEPTKGYALTQWTYWCPVPLFQNATASTVAKTSVNATVSTVTATNSGHGPCGVRVTVSTTDADMNELTVTNAANSYSFAMKADVGLTNGDYVDWFYSDPAEVNYTGASVYLNDTTGAAYMELAPGDNVISLDVTNGTGSCTVTLTWAPWYISL